MEKKTTVYVKLNDHEQVKVEMTHQQLQEWGDVNEREVTVTEADAVAAQLSTKSYLCKSTID